jgi:hypothetical protein
MDARHMLSVVQDLLERPAMLFEGAGQPLGRLDIGLWLLVHDGPW